MLMLLASFGFLGWYTMAMQGPRYNAALAVELKLQSETEDATAPFRHDNEGISNAPEHCTNEQMGAIETQLSLVTSCQPNQNWYDCGFSQQTRCPKSTWIQDLYKDIHEVELASNDSSFLGVTIGCNKAYDAIDTARMGMRNPKFDKTQWVKAMDGLGLTDPGACKQKNAPQFDLKKDLPPRTKGEMHCVDKCQ